MEKIQIVNINNEDYNYDCRICLETDHQNNLIAPCDCSGTQKYVHIDCLNQWRLENLDNEKYYQCEICNRRYIIVNNFEEEDFIYESKSPLSCNLALYLILNYCFGNLIYILDKSNNYESLDFVSFGIEGKNNTIAKELSLDSMNSYNLIYYTSFGVFIISMLFWSIHIILLSINLKRKLVYLKKMFLFTLSNLILSFNLNISYIIYLIFSDDSTFFMTLFGTLIFNFYIVTNVITNHNDIISKMNKDIDNQIIMSINDD